MQVTYELLGAPDARLARRYRRLEASSSAAVFSASAGPTDELEVNNIFFSADYAAEVPRPLRAPHLPGRPDGVRKHHLAGDCRRRAAGVRQLVVLVNAPATRGQDWKGEVERARTAAISRLSAALGRPVGRDIDSEEVVTPLDIERATGSRGGSLYGIASNSRAAAFLRHPNRSSRFPGLYVCGGSAHPGGGMPLAILSGGIVSELVQRYEGL